MPICHFHILITNKTAVDSSETFREEGKLRYAQTLPSAGQRAPVALPAKAAGQCDPAAISSVPEQPAWHSACSTHVWWGRCWKEATLG